MESRQRTSPEQFAMLIEFMERNGDLAKPQMEAQGRLRSKQMWSELTTLLNSVGGGVVKPVDQWKKVWADWKTKTIKKHLDIRHPARGTGGGSSSRHCLTPFEERVVALLGVSAVSGQPKLSERGFNTAAPPAAIEHAFDVEDVVVETHHCICRLHPHPLLHFHFLPLLHSYCRPFLNYHRHSLLRLRLLLCFHPRLLYYPLSPLHILHQREVDSGDHYHGSGHVRPMIH